MQTTRTISNISYNTPEFFSGVIASLVSRGIIEWCYWIVHEPDTDENKQHIHFVLRPSKRLETADLGKLFLQPDPNHEKPLKCTEKWNFTSSMDDWLLYAVHDIGYLLSKGQFRNKHYNFNDLKATDPDALRCDWNGIDMLKYRRLEVLQNAIDNNTPFAILVQQGAIPIAQRSQYEQQYLALARLHTNPPRSGGRKQSHESRKVVEQIDIDGCFIPCDDIQF